VTGTSTLRDRIDPYGPRPDPTAADGPDPYGNPDPEWLRIDWGEKLATADVGGTQVNYVELGRGEPAIVLVHGLSGCWQNWLEQLPAFARHHRVLALDLPGFGDSPPPGWEVSIPAYGRLLDDFCEALDVRDAALVGNSMGGFVAAEAVINQPDRFERLALVSAAGVSSARLRREPTEVVARMLAAAAPYIFRLQTRSFRRPRARALAFANLFRHPSRLRPELLWELFCGGMRAEMFTEALGSLAGYDFLHRLSEVELPTLIVWGRNDHVVPPADALEYNRLLRNSELVIFDECGHLPMAERPVRFNRLLEAFLSS
jgi:pimeloyl-ACP methyl ester carboxylesterase